MAEDSPMSLTFSPQNWQKEYRNEFERTANLFSAVIFDQVYTLGMLDEAEMLNARSPVGFTDESQFS
jgi:hypothetical protein